MNPIRLQALLQEIPLMKPLSLWQCQLHLSLELRRSGSIISLIYYIGHGAGTVCEVEARATHIDSWMRNNPMMFHMSHSIMFS